MTQEDRDFIRADVSFVMAAFAMGGMELQLAALLRRRPAWAKHLNIEIVTLLPSTSAEVEEIFLDQGVHNVLIDRSSLSFPGFLWQLITHFRRTRPHIVHTQLDASAGTWGRLAAILTRVPAIVQSDLSLMVGGTPIQRSLRRFLDARTSLFLPNATAIRDRLAASGARRDRMTVLMPGVDLTRFDWQSTRQLDPGLPDGLVAGFLGRFDPVKRLDVLLDSVITLPEKSRPKKLLLAGDGPTRPLVEQRIALDPWLTENCLVLGRQEDVPAFLRRIDYLIHPSEVEGLPNAVLEAMAMGRPIVGTRVSDVPTIVGDSGFIAEPADINSLAEAILRMQRATPSERAEMGARARNKIENDHDLDEVANRFWVAHENLIPALRGQHE